MVALVIWLVMCALVAKLAAGRGRSWFGFFLLSAVLSPLIGLIVCLCMRNEVKHAEKLAQDAQRRNDAYDRARREEEMLALMKKMAEK